MSTEQPQPPEPSLLDVGPRERDLEQALSGLRPAPMRQSPEQVWYRAGFEAGRRRASAWRAAAAVMALATAGTLTALVGRGPAPQDVGPIADFRLDPSRSAGTAAIERRQTTRVAEAPRSTGGDGSAARVASYLHVREAMAREGWDALPPWPGGSGGSGPPAPRAGPARPAVLSAEIDRWPQS